MIGCGLLVDFFTARYHMFFEDPENLAVKVTFLIVGILGVCLGCSVYMTPELGSAPYDTLGIQIHEKSKIPFKVCRIATDINLCYNKFNIWRQCGNRHSNYGFWDRTSCTVF